MNVKLIRMSSGEDVVTTVLDEREDVIVITNPIVAVPTEKGQIGFAAWSPIMNRQVPEIEVSRKFVVFTTEVDPPVYDHYVKLFSVVDLPPAKKIIV